MKYVITPEISVITKFRKLADCWAICRDVVRAGVTSAIYLITINKR